MGVNKKQYLFNQIIAADPTKNTEDIFNGDLEETYHSMVNAGTIGVASSQLSAAPTDYAKLLPWYAAVASRNISKCVVYYGPGDSITEGAYAGSLGVSDTPARLQAILRNKYPTIGVAGGRGWIPAGNNAPSVTPIAVVSGTSAFMGWGPSFQYVNLSQVAHKVTATLNGTSFDLYGVTGSSTGIGYYKIDGGAAVTFNTFSASTIDNVKFVSQVALTAGNHTIEVGWSSGGPVYFEGFWEYNQDESKGINVIRGGYSGSTTSQWLNSGGGYQWAAIQKTLPNLVILQLGINDANVSGGNISAATFKANLLSIISNLRSSPGWVATTPIVLSMLYTPKAGIALAEPWRGYVTAAAQIAATDSSVVLVDHSIRMPKGDAANTYSLYSGDSLPHPADNGYSYIAETLGYLLSLR